MVTLYNQDLKNFNTFRISALIEKVIVIQNDEDFKKIDFSGIINKTSVLLGEGSNILFVRIPKEIILIRTKGIFKSYENENEIHFTVKAGEIWDEFVEFLVSNKFCGLENMSGIPGTVGAAVINNIGAYGEEVSKYIYKVRAFSILQNKQIDFFNSEIKFEYRNSIFKNNTEYIITEVIFKLVKGINCINVSYGNIKDYFNTKPINSFNMRHAIIEERRQKLPNYKNLGNAGSFFKNPIISKEQYQNICSEYPDLPCFIINETSYKVPAAWLIEKCGLKNYRYKNTGTYSHPLIIVNFNNATGEEILEFSEFIREKVYNRFNVLLEPEVIIY
ncbi:MAG: UDP-N-acetylmuramate dehydrogenase [Bacteroidales bacterium]|nr:UDP-N-acetylmuramate dehydrogenase [Bacteroidales bacterium]